MTRGPGYIYIVNWDRFQHYRDRRPAWIKLYLDLMHKDEYLRLSLADRGLLHDLWKLAGEIGDGKIRADCTLIARQLNVRRVSLEPLIQAGFILVRASKARGDSPVSVTRHARDMHVSVTRRSTEMQPRLRRDSHKLRNHAGSDLEPASSVLAERSRSASPEGSKEPKEKERARAASSRRAAAARSEDPDPPRNRHVNREGLAQLSSVLGIEEWGATA